MLTRAQGALVRVNPAFPNTAQVHHLRRRACRPGHPRQQPLKGLDIPGLREAIFAGTRHFAPKHFASDCWWRYENACVLLYLIKVRCSKPAGKTSYVAADCLRCCRVRYGAGSMNRRILFGGKDSSEIVILVHSCKGTSERLHKSSCIWASCCACLHRTSRTWKSA